MPTRAIDASAPAVNQLGGCKETTFQFFSTIVPHILTEVRKDARNAHPFGRCPRFSSPRPPPKQETPPPPHPFPHPPGRRPPPLVRRPGIAQTRPRWGPPVVAHHRHQRANDPPWPP